MKQKIIFKISLLITFVLILFVDATIKAQDLEKIINGRVTDKFGKPLNGVTVSSENKNNGTLTNVNGYYTININDKSKGITFFQSGYVLEKVSIEGQDKVDVKLEFDAHANSDIVQLGYSTQLRSAISGSVATVSGKELEKSPVANLTQTLAGRLSGLTTQETFSELSRANTNLFIRGLSAGRQNGPLVIIDGIPTAYNSNQSLEYITSNEIESITILKDASTQALYGIQGANGVLVVTTKRGKKGGLQINGRVDQSFNQVTTKPTFYNSAEYAQMRNQAAFNDGLGENHLFSQAQIENYRSGQNPGLYPNYNSYEMFMNDITRMQRVGVNVTGGNDNVQFFSNLNFMHVGGQFKSDQDRYDANDNNTWINYRTNVDMRLNRNLRGYVRLSGNIKRERTPGSSNADVYSSLFSMPPTTLGPLTEQLLDPGTGEVQHPGYQVITTERVQSPTYGMLNRTGYWRHTVTNITSQFGLDLDMNFLTKGLSANGVFAYQTNSVGSLGTTQNYERYVVGIENDNLVFIKKGDEQNTPLAYSKNHSYYYHLTYKLGLNYQRDFGKHQIGGMAYAFYQNLTKADIQSPGLLPYNRLNTGVEATYGYDNRYLIKFDLGYSGSEQYARDTRFTATPAVSAAWVLSNEAFLDNLDWVSNLKIRASYGKTANDQSGLARFAYYDNVTVGRGGPIGYHQYIINENQIGNPYIQAEIATKQNYGVDLVLMKSLAVSLDVFSESMKNMVVDAGATIPLYQGIPLANYPQTNTGEFKNQGYEFTASYTRHINANLMLNLGGLFSYAKNTLINSNEPLKTSDYSYRKWKDGYAYGQQFGYLVDYSNGNGFFNSPEEINNSNLAYGFGQPRVGDLKYRDLNGDNQIDERDKAPIGSGVLPRFTYGFSGGVTYKSFDLSFLLQGVGDYSSTYSGTGVYETSFDGVFGDLHRNAWTAERYANGEEITAPALSTLKSVNHESNDFYNMDRSYLRLKNVELAYTLPASVSKAIAAEKIRFILSGQNLITWDNMKTKDFGPESSGYTSFPVYRAYNFGVNVIF